MTTHKQLEQELKRPDSFQDHILKALNYTRDHKEKVALMITPVVAVIAIGYGIYAWQHNQASTRRAELAKIIASQAEETNSVAKQTESIQKEIDAIRQAANPSAKPGEKKAELSADNLLKISALEKRLAEAKPDHSKSAADFWKFYDANKENAEGWMAGISWCTNEIAQGKIAETKPILEQIVKASTSNKFYQIQSRFMLANILEELGEFDTALKEADVLAGLVQDEAKPMVLLLKGQLLYFKKDLTTARTVLSEIIEKHGSTREAQTARSLLTEIGPA